jgi:hypothetical protein
MASSTKVNGRLGATLRGFLLIGWAPGGDKAATDRYFMLTDLIFF